ncbi:MAG: hypothetical protein FJ110_12220 [Deltaproteobacteria bacterium]|nr:hypothetical protein [Deltaproteobacteria bacterium]
MAKKIIHLLWALILLFGVLSCGPSGRDESKVKVNSPPVITSVKILPEKATRDNDLIVAVEGNDPDQDSITYHYQWIKNDAEMVGENRNVLKIGAFKKGDLIRVKVMPSDGKAEGKPFLSNEVTIRNSPPTLQEVRIEPKMASASDELKAVVKGADPDGDFIYYTYKWEINDTVLTEEEKEVLGRNRFKKGDSVTVTVIPDDREVTGTPKKSDRVVISNSIPIIVSSPPTSVEKSTYLYQVKINDPDHDPITFFLKSGPKGMEIDKNTGLIRWEIRKEDKGAHQIEIEVSDNEGAKSIQAFTVTVDIKGTQ